MLGWNRLGRSEINPHTYVTLFMTKGARTYKEEKTVSLISGARKTEQLHTKE